MNVVNNTALHQLVAQAVRKLPVDTSNDAFSTVSNTAANASTLTSGIAPVASTTSDNSSQDSTYEESFAKLLMQLKTGAAAFDSSADSNLALAQATSDNASATTAAASTGTTVASTGDSSVSADSSTSQSTALKDFLAYMNESPAEKLREKMTGVSKSEYDSMTPDQQAAIDKKVQDSLKQQQETATADVNSKILAARLALV